MRHIGISVLSCTLLFVCGLLSAASSAANLPVAENKVLSTAQNNTGSAQPHIKGDKILKLKEDPTRPPSVIAAQLSSDLGLDPAYELTAIFTRHDQQYAIVNGNIVQTGDHIADMRVIDISSTKLIMQNRLSAQNEVVLALSGAINVKQQVTK